MCSTLNAAELNNVGVGYLQRGDCRTAHAYFQDALIRAMEQVRCQEESSMIGDQASRQPRDAQGKPGLNRTRNSGLNDLKFKDIMISYQEKGSLSSIPFVHNTAILVTPAKNAYSPDDLVQTITVASIIVFNLALIYHVKGLEGNNCMFERLGKALSLYGRSRRMLRDVGVRPGTGHPIIDLLVMCLANNEAQCYFELGDYTASQLHFGQLMASINTPTQIYRDLEVNTLLDQYKSHFFLNALILRPPQQAAAA